MKAANERGPQFLGQVKDVQGRWLLVFVKSLFPMSLLQSLQSSLTEMSEKLWLEMSFEWFLLQCRKMFFSQGNWRCSGHTIVLPTSIVPPQACPHRSWLVLYCTWTREIPLCGFRCCFSTSSRRNLEMSITMRGTNRSLGPATVAMVLLLLSKIFFFAYIWSTTTYTSSVALHCSAHFWNHWKLFTLRLHTMDVVVYISCQLFLQAVPMGYPYKNFMFLFI